ncbi:N-acetyltransferase [Jiangella sp. DSM 45060]|uniref:GNAT family N-acetyltransferase n=1 Tax=Jiangella sp. DSM 45060 TaxID=1798224 RepID=UPI0012FE1199|nr:GNAT family N-acetyltransferase [Jiangella sp. DSM 45060]
MTIRRATLDDQAAMRDVCLRTGHGGQDATGSWSDDGLRPDAFLEPYVRYPASRCWVVDDGAGTAAAARPAAGPGLLHDAGTLPDRMLDDASAPLPAHLHVDMLPELQRRGHGRRLMRALGESLAADGVPGVHLRVGDGNQVAVASCRRLGFDERHDDDGYLMTIASQRLAAL